jgi:hypothetical protein
MNHHNELRVEESNTAQHPEWPEGISKGTFERNPPLDTVPAVGAGVQPTTDSGPMLFLWLHTIGQSVI